MLLELELPRVLAFVRVIDQRRVNSGLSATTPAVTGVSAHGSLGTGYPPMSLLVPAVPQEQATAPYFRRPHRWGEWTIP